MAPIDSSLGRLARAAKWTGLRLRADEGLARGLALLPVPALYALGALTYIKVARPGRGLEETLMWLVVLPLALPLGAAIYGLVRPRPASLGSLALDRHYGLHDRITNALAFSAVPPLRRSPLMQAAIEDALRTVGVVRARDAAPIRLPGEIPIVVLLVAGLVTLAQLEVRATRVLAPPPAPTVGQTLPADDLDLFSDLADELARDSKDPQTLAAVRRFNQLIEDLAHRRLDRREVFRRLEELERELSQDAREGAILEEALRNVASELRRSDLTKPVAEPLAEKRLADAEKALQELAEKLRNRGSPPSKAELDRLRQALRRASEANAARERTLDEEEREARAERDSLLRKKQEQGLSEREQGKLAQREKQLERLDRQKKQQAQARRQITKLDRELAEAAEQLLKQLGKSADSLESAAQELNRMAAKELSRREKQDLLRRLQELREVLRQQGKAGQEQLNRLNRFARKARGQDRGGEDGAGSPDKGGVRPGGVPLPIPGSGAEAGLLDRGGMRSGDKAGSGQRSSPAQGGGKGDKPASSGAGERGADWGVGHDENLTGEKSELKGQTKDVAAAGQDTGRGEASAEVIMGAADRGFVGRAYRSVYREYEAVAEEAMVQDDIPPGYRFYVQRYFQLIRPRE